MEENIERKGIKQQSSPAETSLSHDLKCSHLLHSVTSSHSSETHCCSTPTPLLLPSLSSVTGSFYYSSSHLVNITVTPSNLYSVFHTERLHKVQQPCGSVSNSPVQTPELLNTQVILPLGSSGLGSPAQQASLFICMLTQSFGPTNNPVLVTISHHSFLDLLYHEGLSSKKYFDMCCSAVAKTD